MQRFIFAEASIMVNVICLGGARAGKITRVTFLNSTRKAQEGAGIMLPSGSKLAWLATIALAIYCSSVGAAEYNVSDEAQLRQAIIDNANIG
ncbi:hypothetical protein [Pseudomonas sp. MYb187]|uniref:hypothetical protein n=1 Tax=Pseudomonas sp. MYb187 TaxID=1827299 RepID=UPI0011B00D04|nr:hypothetical protein [Pseudomonas sp. MYb187]